MQLSSMVSVSVSALTALPESAERNKPFHKLSYPSNRNPNKYENWYQKWGIAIQTDRLGRAVIAFELYAGKAFEYSQLSIGCSV